MWLMGDKEIQRLESSPSRTEGVYLPPAKPQPYGGGLSPSGRQSLYWPSGNGKVDIFDLALVAGNYGMSSADAYADWLQ